MPIHKKKKLAVEEVITPEEPEVVTYRLSLVDSKNRAVQMDIELKDIPHDLNKLYTELILKENEDKQKIEAGDKELEKRLEKEKEERFAKLPSNICKFCKFKWKGGTFRCPKCGEVNG